MKDKISGKFIEILKTFSEEELKDFKIWLNSAWCNTNKNLPKLLEKLKKYHPDFDHKLLTKERLFKQVMPGKKYSVYWLNNLMHQAYIQAKRFLMSRRLFREEALQTDLLTQEFQDRSLDKFFSKTIHQKN